MPRHSHFDDWLTSGGDHRLEIDPSTGLSRYRVAPHPRDTAPFGSCSASSPSERSMNAVAPHLAALRSTSNPSSVVHEGTAGIRARLSKIMRLREDETCALAPSGTDAIYLVSALALRGADRVHHVVVGASELGGGTLAASQGLCFSPTPPFATLDAAAPISGLAGRCSAEPLFLRTTSGVRRTPDEVDAATFSAVEAAIKPGARIVVHLVAHSKTGLRNPSAALARQLTKTFGDQVLVLVDAAQGRLAPRDVRQALDYGFMVLFTGSKFYSGPPFSGVIFVPSGLSTDPGPLPVGLSDWISRADLPSRWPRARASLRVESNPGLYLRWVAAMAEIEAYHAIPIQLRGRVYHVFAGGVYETFGPSKSIEIDAPMPPVHELVTSLGAYPSVFGFRVHDDSGPLNAKRLDALHTLLDSNLSQTDPTLSAQYHLGRPVSLGPPTADSPALLRVAMGGRLVTDLNCHPDAGARWLRPRLLGVREKIEALLSSGRV